MSAFTKDTFSVSESFKKALEQVAEHKEEINESDIQVPGYGTISKDAVHKEIGQRTKLAEKFASEGNHRAAAYHHSMVATFHNAIATHHAKEKVFSGPLGNKHNLQPMKNEEVLDETLHKVGTKVQVNNPQRSSHGDVGTVTARDKEHTHKVQFKGKKSMWYHGADLKRVNESSEESRVARSLARQRKQKDKSKNKKDED